MRHVACCLLPLILAGCLNPNITRQGEVDRFNGYLKNQAKDLNIDPAVPLSMARCEEIALANSLDLRVKELTLRLQDDRIALALSQGLPTANLTYTDLTRSNEALVKNRGAVARTADTHQQLLTINALAPVLDFGLTYYSFQIAVDRKHQEELLLKRSEQLLRRDIRVAYARHAAALRQLKLAETAYAANLQVLRVTKSLERAKIIVPADTALVEAAVAQATLELANVRNSVYQTKLTLAQLMSLPPGVNFSINEQLPPLPPTPSIELVAVFEDRALHARPELCVQDLEDRISLNDVSREASNFFPHLDLAGFFTWTSATGLVNPAFFLGGFQVTQSLLNGGANLANYDLARKRVDVERERALLVSLGVLYEVQFDSLRVRLAMETVKASVQLEAARKAGLARTVSLYNEGLEDEAGAARSLADLTAQATILDQNQTEYLTAWYELYAAVLPPDYDTTPAPAGQATSAPASQPATTQPTLPEGK